MPCSSVSNAAICTSGNGSSPLLSSSMPSEVEFNLGQMALEVERAAAGQAKVIPVSHAGGTVHNPDVILKAIVEAVR